MRRHYHGQKGFTLLELLIVVVILGLLAGLLVPRLVTFLGTGNVAAANTEVAYVETAALCYYADNLAWPSNCSGSSKSLLKPPAGAKNAYINKAPKYYNYTFNNTTGKVSIANGTKSLVGNLKWNFANHKWIKL